MAQPGDRVTLWSPLSLVLGGCFLGFALIGVSMLFAPDDQAGPVARALYAVMGLVSAYLAVRSVISRVRVNGSTLTIFTYWGTRRIVRFVAVVHPEPGGSDFPFLHWSAPAVTTASGEVIGLSELAGYDPFGRANRRVVRACEVLRHAVEQEPPVA